MTDPLADFCAIPSASSLLMWLKLLFLDDDVEGAPSFPFCSGWASLLNVGNNGGSWPLSWQKTLSTVSLISFPKPFWSKINSHADLEAFSSAGVLHRISNHIRSSVLCSGFRLINNEINENKASYWFRHRELKRSTWEREEKDKLGFFNWQDEEVDGYMHSHLILKIEKWRNRRIWTKRSIRFTSRN